MKRVKRTKEQELEICKAYSDGISLNEIGRKFNIAANALDVLLIRNGFELKYRSELNSVSAETLELIREDILNKATIPELSKKYKISNKNIRLIRARLNLGHIAKRQQSTSILNTADIIEKYLTDGWDVTRLARLYKVHYSRIVNVIKENKVFGIKPRRTKLDPHTKNIVDLYSNQNQTIEKIAKQFNVSYGSIRRVLKINNVKIRPFVPTRKPKLNPSQQLEICDLYGGDCATIQDLCQKYNVSLSTIRTILIKNNIQMKRINNQSSKLTSENETRIINLYTKENKTLRETADIMKMSVFLIKKYLKKTNIKIKTAQEFICTPLKEADEQNIIKDYIDRKESMKSILKKYKIRQRRFYKILNKYGHKTRKSNDTRMYQFTNEQIRTMIDTYSKINNLILLKNENKNLYNNLSILAPPLWGLVYHTYYYFYQNC